MREVHQPRPRILGTAARSARSPGSSAPGPCHRCVLDQRVRDLLGDGTGAIRPELAPFHEALTSAAAPRMSPWPGSPGRRPRTCWNASAGDERRVTHEVLDELPGGKVLGPPAQRPRRDGALPPRDERLVALEKWITETVQARTDLAERRILHGYAVWHHLRRLRRRLGDQHTTRLQDLNVRCHVTAGQQLPRPRLAAEGPTLGTCTQTDLERLDGRPASQLP